MLWSTNVKREEMVRIWSVLLAHYTDDWRGFLKKGMNFWIP